MAKSTILISVSDEGLWRELRSLLTPYGYEVAESPDITSTRRLVQTERPDLIIIGFSQEQGLDGLEVIHQIRSLDRRVPILMITHTDELILAAFRAGVKDCLRRVFSVGELLASVQRCLENNNHSTRRLPKSETTASAVRSGNWMIGSSAAIEKVRAFIEKIASTNSDVLVTGETGTGKELVAELIHLTSPRRQKPMVSISCAAISENLLEGELFGYEKGAFRGAHSSSEGKLKLAEGGTVYFDEIGHMSSSAQATILRAIDNRNVHESRGRRTISLDIRVIAATSQDVEAGVKNGRICEDLYYKLNVARIHLRPLRERKEDIRALLEYYLGTFNQVFGRQVEGCTDEVLEYLLRYDWPGNVRELRDLLESIFVGLHSNIISASDLLPQYRNKFEGQG
jgi:DNA-binding NtrC family response regulator